MTSSQITREALPNNLAKELQLQIRGLSRADLSKHTFEHVKSQYKGARTDYFVYDPSGKLVLLGRGFGNKNFFWTPTTDPRLTNS